MGALLEGGLSVVYDALLVVRRELITLYATTLNCVRAAPVHRRCNCVELATQIASTGWVVILKV